jgi:hypothetical protein
VSTVSDHRAPGATDYVDGSERALVDALVPPPRSRKWGLLIALVAGGVVGVVALATLSGTVVPRLSASTDSWSAARSGGVHYTFKLHNDGLRPATITAIDLDAAGLAHGRLSVHLPLRVAAHHDVTITATFSGLRCERIQPRQFKSGIRLTARGDFPFASTVTASLLSHFSDEFVGSRTYSGSDPLQIGWPAGITQIACGR